MRVSLLGFAVLTPAPAFAHGGHIGELAGHSHWVGVAALAGAVLVAGAAAWAGRKAKANKASDKADDKDPADASAEGTQ
ncbi:DUF6732 family protein [Roseibium denhamense]|uniref:LPXTG cell wall anchor domain-containing protein n=1 Tax=Roseibium denhamense TaxID=76305 RepID=A0ABY1PLT6_9HYPH|nr:DUF6732 family protein [Roseibium denhamense]SMP34650.1 hypothetical protein SAMN06265374_3900 [Roseibium denhamense]